MKVANGFVFFEDGELSIQTYGSSGDREWHSKLAMCFAVDDLGPAYRQGLGKHEYVYLPYCLESIDGNAYRFNGSFEKFTEALSGPTIENISATLQLVQRTLGMLDKKMEDG